MSTATLLLPLPDVVLGDLTDRIKVDDNGCWLWQGTRQTSGYGWWPGGRQLAHRAVYELACGAIPPGHDVDHVCHNADESCPGGRTCRHRLCVNPSHLRAATRTQNNLGGRLGQAVRARAAAQTHCKYGHEYTPENTRLTPAGTRACRACGRERFARAVAARPPRPLRTHCVNGHPFDDDNTYLRPSGSRACRTCRRDDMARFHDKNGAKGALADETAGSDDTGDPADE